MKMIRWRGAHVHWLHSHVQRDRAIRVSSAHAMPIGDGYMTKRFRLDELGHMVRPPGTLPVPTLACFRGVTPRVYRPRSLLLPLPVPVPSRRFSRLILAEF